MSVLSASELKTRFETYLDRLSSFDFDVFNELWAADAVQVNPYAPDGFPAEYPKGAAAIRKVYQQNFKDHAEVVFENRNVYADEDRQAVFATFDGSLKRKSGAHLKPHYAMLVSFDDHGRISRYAEYFNPDFIRSIIVKGL